MKEPYTYIDPISEGQLDVLDHQEASPSAAFPRRTGLGHPRYRLFRPWGRGSNRLMSSIRYLRMLRASWECGDKLEVRRHKGIRN